MFETRRVPGFSLDGASCSGAAAGPLVFELEGQQRSQQRLRLGGFASVSAAASDSSQGFNPLFMLARAAKQAVRKFKVVKVAGDGRCMFRALAKGMAYHQGTYLSGETETQDADELRMAVSDAVCRDDKRRGQFKEALLAIKAEHDLDHYCHHIQEPSFWGGEAELLVLSKMLKVPIVVYLSNKETKRGSRDGYTPIAKYGVEHAKHRKAVRLLYTGGNHYDLLLT